jgi:hypothetical protein
VMPTTSETSRTDRRRFTRITAPKHFLNMIIVRWGRRPSSFGIALGGRSARFETLVTFVTLCTA